MATHKGCDHEVHGVGVATARALTWAWPSELHGRYGNIAIIITVGVATE